MGSPQELLRGFADAIRGAVDPAQICTSDVEFRDAMAQTTGTDALRGYLKSWSTAFPDAQITVENILVGGDQAVGEIHYRGTHTGPLVGPPGTIPPTGRSVDLHGAGWITIRDGRISRFTGYYDTMTMMVQLGVAPTPAGVQ